MLEKEFFKLESFNPAPYQDNIIVDLTGASKFDSNTVFYAGRYQVLVRAGSNTMYGTDGRELLTGFPVEITKIITIPQNFIIRAYCGGKSIVNLANQSIIVGTNPYSGAFKVNGTTTNTSIPTVSHIFGNAGSCGLVVNSSGVPILSSVASSGNCLGDGASVNVGRINASSAGSCLHILPVGGVFGTDYLFAFHCSGCPGLYQVHGGCGSAYGGAASGGSNSNSTTYNGGDTPYGTGGIGVSNAVFGNPGTGIGSANNGSDGSGAFFNGTNWINEIYRNNLSEVDGKIIIKYLGPLR